MQYPKFEVISHFRNHLAFIYILLAELQTTLSKQKHVIFKNSKCTRAVRKVRGQVRL